MTRKRSPPSGEGHALLDQVTAAYVHRLFPEFRLPAYLACPDQGCTAACLDAITRAAKKKQVPSEIIDLHPAPADRLNAVTARLRDANDRGPVDPALQVQLLILHGFDLLEGAANDEPTYPFRSRFQFDQEHLWLFVGQDWKRLARLFTSYKLPLYRAASDITPAAWRR